MEWRRRKRVGWLHTSPVHAPVVFLQHARCTPHACTCARQDLAVSDPRDPPSRNRTLIYPQTRRNPVHYVHTQPRTQYFLPICTHARALQIPVPCLGARRLTRLKSPAPGLLSDVSIVAAVQTQCMRCWMRTRCWCRARAQPSSRVFSGQASRARCQLVPPHA